MKIYKKLLALSLISLNSYGQFPNNHKTVVNEGAKTSTKEISLSSNKYENCYLTGFTGFTPRFLKVGADITPLSVGWKLSAKNMGWGKIIPSRLKASGYCQTISRNIWNKNGSNKSKFYKNHLVTTARGKDDQGYRNSHFWENNIDYVKVNLGSIENQFCWLSGFSGTFHGESEEVAVIQLEGNWWASAKRYDHSKTRKVKTKVTCAPSNSLPNHTIYLLSAVEKMG